MFYRYKYTKIKEDFVKGKAEKNECIKVLRHEFFKKCKDLETKVKDVEEKLSKCIIKKPILKPICAFVTFNESLSSKFAIDKYNLSLYKWIFMDKIKKYKDYRISVTEAPDPS